MSDEELKQIITQDLLERQFLATGRITRSVYQPTATFTDEIDTYSLEQWVTGTQKLFVGEQSAVRLVGDVQVTPEKVEFRFDEDLMFRIPFRPVVSLTGKVVLERDLETGLITSYREFWDQDVWSVLKTAKFWMKESAIDNRKQVETWCRTNEWECMIKSWFVLTLKRNALGANLI